MLFNIDTHSGVPIYRQLIDQIRKQVVTGLLKSGDQLDTVRDLAARLKINPMTVSKAYSLLEAEGLIQRRRGVGLFVAPVNPERAARAKAQILDNVLTKAAITVVQLDIEEAEAVKLFQDYIRRNSNERIER